MGEADDYTSGGGQQLRGGPPYGLQYGQQYGQQQQWQQPQQDYYNNNNTGSNQGWNNQGYDQQQPQQQPQQGYGAPPPYSFNPPQANDEKYGFDQAFKVEKPKYNDWWAGLLFLAAFAGFVVVSGIAIHGYVTGRPGSGIYQSNNNGFSLNSNTIILFAFVLVVAFVLSWGYVWLARAFPKQFIWVTGILNICWALGTAIFYLYKKYWSAGIVFLVFALFTIFAFWTWIPRIPFSALMLKTAINVSKKYGHVYLVSLIGGLIATAFAAWFSVTMVAIYVKYEPSPQNPNCGADGSGCSKATLIGLMVFITFAMYWISEWLKNTIHTTISGVYGSWYFCVHNFPKGATRGAARRALTYSFGSISLGSLLVAIVQFLRQVCSVARDQVGGGGGIGDMIGYVIFCVINCLLSLLEWALQFLNRYAFCHIALYGKPYFQAAKDTWNMIKDRGIDALVNECLIGPVLSFGAMFIGFACALMAYLYLIFTKPAYNTDGGFTAVVVAFSYLIGFQIAHVFTTPLSSGIDAIFVASGWDPQVMINDHPELYQEMVRVFPKVQQAIQVR
ncbi:Putative choline transporter, neither null mutation nor overexpression affects choline transport [Purpureocillium takamizusanense]|uniref:Protein PNS1 n=1 Tax=Purpureocillium takamizusanense TaxID=2060973 RepID=A0A9Q8Q749_9HYPO|nr:Putative choline transporter, neither null mutation nor overexpression affects choline transport [Purpureocillium takamizusanense]UNI13916.1 Putative choline transporter, neither null mutation nor overexpression affects choline transport [Purpureocillium takamizusanense]